MAHLTDSNGNYARKRAGVKKTALHHLKIDMTPMVDLGFLLITFFVITTELSEPRSMNLNMPKESQIMSKLGNSYALTVIAGKDRHFYYHGDWREAKQRNEVLSFSSNLELRYIINEKLKKLEDRSVFKEGREGMMLLLKPTEHTSYKTLVDVLDEILITGVKKHAIVKLSSDEIKWLEFSR
jgi:biopolymer transport protein ExbD